MKKKKREPKPPFEVGKLYRKVFASSPAYVTSVEAYIDAAKNGSIQGFDSFTVFVDDIVMIVGYRYFSGEELADLLGGVHDVGWWKVDVLGKKEKVGFIWLKADVLGKKEKVGFIWLKADGVFEEVALHALHAWEENYEKIGSSF